MKRSLQEYVELVVFGLIALLVGTGLLWLLGWVLSLGGIVLKGLAGLLWMLLRFVVPVAIAGGLVYFLVKAAQDRQKPTPVTAGGSSGDRPAAPGVIDVAPASEAAQAAQQAGDSVVASATDVADDVVADVESAVSDVADAVEAAAEEASDTVADVRDALDEDDEQNA